jgi:hypothetical protein
MILNMYKLLSIIIFFLLLACNLTINIIDISAQDNTVKISTDKVIYNIDEIVNITIKNIGSDTLTWPTPCSLLGIKNNDTGSVIIDPINWPACPDVIFELQPGETKFWPWEQTDINLRQVLPGMYIAYVAWHFDPNWNLDPNSTKIIASTKFAITNGSANINSNN